MCGHFISLFSFRFASKEIERNYLQSGGLVVHVIKDERTTFSIEDS